MNRKEAILKALKEHSPADEFFPHYYHVIMRCRCGLNFVKGSDVKASWERHAAEEIEKMLVGKDES